MRLIALILLALVTGCRDGDRLRAVVKCGLPCWEQKASLENVGQCRSGTWVCTDDDEATAVCKDQVLPGAETCDGQDNDCDGDTDELVTRACQNSCGKGIEICVEGSFMGCTAPTPAAEVCDGKDNNCDGRVDEPEALPVEFCYEGPMGSTQFGVCRPGTLRCQYGQKTCTGQILPSPEDCDGEDNDCDGAIDEGTNSGDPVDIVFCIDNSGSMGATISAVKQAVAAFSNTYGGRTDIRWALTVCPDPDIQYDGDVRVFQNFGTAAAFSGAVQQMAATGGGSEPTLDAIHMLLDPANPLALTWTSGSKHVIVIFTDESPQSYLVPALTNADVYADLQATAAKVYIFTDQLGQSLWGPVLPPGKATFKTLSDIPSVMENELTNVIQENSCH